MATQEQAQRLADFLLTRGIRSQLEPGETECALWVIDEDRVADARIELARFLEDPTAPQYAAAADAAGELRDQADARERQIRRNMVDVRSQWTRPAAASPVTWLLIGISVAVTLATDFGEKRGPDSLFQKLNIARLTPVRDGLEYKFLTSPESDVRQGEVWRLITPIFLHFSVLHLLFNMMATRSLGGVVEARYGSWQLAILVLVLAVVSNLAEYWWSGPRFGGMSGVAFGLFGLAWMKSRFDPLAGIHIDPGSVTTMLLFLVLCMTGAIGSIANAAHLSGLAAGMFIGLAPVVWRRLMR